MTTVNVQFSDHTETEIITYFACQQDPDGWPNIGVVGTGDARWASFYDAQPASVQSHLPAVGG